MIGGLWKRAGLKDLARALRQLLQGRLQGIHFPRCFVEQIRARGVVHQVAEGVGVERPGAPGFVTPAMIHQQTGGQGIQVGQRMSNRPRALMLGLKAIAGLMVLFGLMALLDQAREALLGEIGA